MSVERELMLTGIGGQGVQLAAEVLARAAVLERRHVLLFGSYGGTMRGGNTDSTLVVADEPVSAPPIVSRLWGALAMHHQFWAPVARRLRPGAVVLLNGSLFEPEPEEKPDAEALRVYELPATQLASELGSPLAASMLLVGALAGLTALVGIDPLLAAVEEALPAYRRQHLELNQRALRAGFEAVPRGACPAWAPEDRAA